MVLLAVMDASSLAAMASAPPTAAVPCSTVYLMYASARLLTMLLAKTALMALPPALTSAEAADVASLPTVALIRAVDSAVRERSPAMSSSESTM